MVNGISTTFMSKFIYLMQFQQPPLTCMRSNYFLKKFVAHGLAFSALMLDML